MAQQTTMIIITSDENIVRQFTSNLDENTYMIPLDDNNTRKTTTVEVNTRNDQVSKRTIDATTNPQLTPVKTRKKSLDLLCTICGDRAIGYNYAVLSCASCKAFFHRNGQYDSKRFKCLTDHGQCVIDVKVSRKCYRCRLERCLTMGMRKDLLLTQTEIQKRKHSNRNQNISLTEQDWTNITDIHSKFLSVINNCEDLLNSEYSSDETSDLIYCLQSNNDAALQIIQFCRLLDEFEKLHADDRFLLIKYNLIILFCLSTSCIMKQPNACSNWNESDEDKQFMYALCNQSESIYRTVINVGTTLKSIIEQDEVILSLLLVITLFSKGLSMNENEPILSDSLAVYRVQSYHTILLWNYLMEKYGEIKTCAYFSQLISVIFQAQSAALQFREFLGNRMRTLNAVDQIVPLMQTILHIS